MIIDFHTHIFPDNLADKAITKLSASGGIPVFSDAKADSLIKSMQENGVDISVVLNVATNVTQVDNVNRFALYIKENYEKLIPFGSLHPLSENPRDIIKTLKDNGIKGLKLHPDYVRVPVDDESYAGIFAAADEFDMPVVIHTGWDFVSPDFIHASVDAILKVISRFPELKLVCAHFGNNRLWDNVITKLCGKRVFFDTAFASERLGMTKEIAETIIQNHDDEKILFGSDMPWCEVGEVKSFIDSLDISSEQKEKIYYKNAIKLLDLSELV
jgi:predicted TIM-barrel fold metal-dependent hydrolase